MPMKKLSIIILFFLLGHGLSHAQLFPVFSQYYFNELTINPAYAGAHVQLSATTTYRNQWINFPGAPKTMAFTAHSSFMRGKVGVGLLANVDKIGSYANKDLSAIYAYRLKFGSSTLSFGLQAMMYFMSADFSNLNLKDPGFNDFVPINLMRPNIGTGIYYSRKNFFAGLSVPMLMNADFSKSGLSAPVKQARNYFLRSGFISNLDDRGDFKINPSFLLRLQEGQPVSADLNAAVIFYDVFSAGASYRVGFSTIGFVSLKITEQLYFNYSYDFTRNDMRPFSNGTHELMLNYRYKISRVHKNLPCPGYFNYHE
jgi:type IX secretion system PorP/SprF family membrane protein